MVQLLVFSFGPLAWLGPPGGGGTSGYTSPLSESRRPSSGLDERATPLGQAPWGRVAPSAPDGEAARPGDREATLGAGDSGGVCFCMGSVGGRWVGV